MRTLLLALVCCLLVPVCGTAQEAAPEPVLLVYVHKPSATQIPPPWFPARIALGLEQPALKVTAFAKCVQTGTSTGIGDLDGLAVQLQPEDAKTLTAALEAAPSSDLGESPFNKVWLATAKNTVLDYLNKDMLKASVANGGVIFLSGRNQAAAVRHLTITGNKP